MRVIAAAVFLGATALVGLKAYAAPTATTTHGATSTSLDASIATNDLIAGLIATELPGDLGWHGANPASGDSLNPDGLPAFTDGVGMLASGLTGLLNDFPPNPGDPVKRVRYDLAAAADIGKIQILTGNNGRDGRVFSTTVISTSTNGVDFTPLGYFQSDPSGTTNFNQTWGSTLVEITESGGGPLATGVTNLIFEFYSVHRNNDTMHDPFTGLNPFTGADDGLDAAFTSPLVLEIDVIAIPEPASCLMGALVLAGLAAAHRR